MEGLQIVFAVVLIFMFIMMIGTLELVFKIQKIKKEVKDFKKKNEDQLAKERIAWERENCLGKREREDIKKENEALHKSNASNQGWNVKYRKTIEEGKEITSELIEELEEKIVYMQKVDESKIVTEKLLTMVKKKDMEEAKAIVKSYYKM